MRDPNGIATAGPSFRSRQLLWVFEMSKIIPLTKEIEIIRLNVRLLLSRTGSKNSQRSQPEHLPADNISSFIIQGDPCMLFSSADILQFANEDVNKLDCRISPYFTADTQIIWSGKEIRASSSGSWFTCTIKHRARKYSTTAFLIGSSKQVERVARRAEMVLEEILKGNASLALGDAEVREEGTYSCLVSVASLTGEQSIQLQIEEKPTVTVNITSLSLVEGEQHKLVCNIRHYYPHNTQAQWLQEPKDTWKVPDVMKNVLSGGDQQSSNGTYSSSRCFLLTASLKDGGHKYTCWVDHPSLQSPIRRSMTVEVRGTPLTWGHCPLHP
ncbi:LOW QUALITY PROTEIN: tapasin-related protein-like [Aquila chrysaetos chrysaetos]|uniref:LOW QUALITY PROTEIN: tapasin-related protein-like n=1 Tax=Aquila chrysaetos chrysaetos TaxID=223781 RepID=UPI001176F742|nr:LOW QUALITY PROTEIN: tapasin-related protein-like [Aquila chrysaetos chrysaetos]